MARKSVDNPTYVLDGVPLEVLALREHTMARLAAVAIRNVEQLAWIPLLTSPVVRNELVLTIEHDLRVRLSPHTVSCSIQIDAASDTLVRFLIESNLFHFVATTRPGEAQACTCTYTWIQPKGGSGVPFQLPQRPQSSRRRRRTTRHTAAEQGRQQTLPFVAPHAHIPSDRHRESRSAHSSQPDSGKSVTPEAVEVATAPEAVTPETATPTPMATTPAAPSLSGILRQLLCTLQEREQTVLTLRYGLDQREGQTLEAIGQQLGVTRERVRQIEHKAIRKLLSMQLPHQVQSLVTHLSQAVAQAGGMLSLPMAYRIVEGDSPHADMHPRLLTELLLHFAPDIKEVKKAAVIIDKQGFGDYEAHIVPTFAVLKRVLKQAAAPLPVDELLNRLVADERGNTISQQVSQDFLVACLKTHPDVVLDTEGTIGLASWTHDRLATIITVLRTHGTPLHYGEITDRVNEHLPPDQHATAHNVHAQMGRLTEIFVRVGHGIFGLAEWGLDADGCVADAAYRILDEAGIALDIADITDRVLETWHVKPTSVRAAIDLDQRFARVAPHRYTLAQRVETTATSVDIHTTEEQHPSLTQGEHADVDTASVQTETDNAYISRDDVNRTGPPKAIRKVLTSKGIAPRRTRARNNPAGMSARPSVEPITKPWDAYDTWNHALITYVLAGKQQGMPVFLSVDDDTIGQVAEQLSEPDQEPQGDFFTAVRKRVIRNKRIKLAALYGRNTYGEPLGVAFLAAMVIAASRMAETEDDEQDSHAAHNYFTRFRDVLDLPGQGRPAGMKAGAEEALWNEWSQWLIEQGFLPSTHNRGEGSTKFISYPISQALLRGVDKDRLCRLFTEKQWPQDWDTETLMVYIQRERPYLTKHLQKLLSSDAERLQAVTEAIYEVYENWESGAYTSRRSSGQSVNRNVRAGLMRSEDSFTGKVTYRLYPRLSAKRQRAPLHVVAPTGVHALSVERPGWYIPIYQLTAQDLDRGVRFNIESPTNLDTLMLPAHQFWILVPDPDDPEAGAYASWGNPQLGIPFIVLCHRSILHQLERLRDERLIQWQDHPHDIFGTGDWLEIDQCQVISQAWGGIAIENQELYDMLRPRENLNISLSSGLRAPDKSGWMEAYGPEITIFGFQSAVHVTISHYSGSHRLWEQEQPINKPFMFKWSDAGDYLIEAEGSGDYARRLVRIVSWDKIQRASVCQPEHVAINGWYICGALIDEQE